MVDSFILTALIGGIGIALMAGPIGSVMVWKRMAFFGDALSHSALLGVAFALILNLHVHLGIVCATLVFSAILVISQKQRAYSSDTILGILAHGTLALGLVVISVVDITIDLYSFLFGDILAINYQDITIIYSVGILAFAILFFSWRPLVLSTINADLAQAEGVNTQRIHMIFMLLIAIIVALSVKIVGVLLVTSLLIIPAATARLFASTPERMAFLASMIGSVSVLLGIFASTKWDIPTGPAIVVSMAILFALSACCHRWVRL